jgi:hypothetical protein
MARLTKFGTAIGWQVADSEAKGIYRNMMDGEAETRKRPRQQPEPKADGVGVSARPVIALHDLRMGPEAEIERLKTQLATLTVELDNLRSEHQRLIAGKQILTAELLEMKLVLSKIQADELRGLEKGNSWLRPFKMLL